MIETQSKVQRDLFGEIDSPTIAVEESARRLKVSTATIRNWVKAHYLEQAEKGKITLESLERFELEVHGKEKLTSRVNKSFKDVHDHIEVASSFVEKVSFHDTALDKIGDEYEASLSESYRNKEGIYYTPKEIVSDLLQQPRYKVQDAQFCDPCCGSGNFIMRAIQLGFKPENVFGYDMDPVAVEITKARVRSATGCKSLNIEVADFLDMSTTSTPHQFDYIYTNPPWGKKIAKKERKILGLSLGAGNSIDTCSLFFFACLKSLKRDGELGLLLPESFFYISAFEDARKKSLQFSIQRLVNYGKAFKDLVTNAQSIVLKNKPPKPYLRVSCESNSMNYQRSYRSFYCNPKSILNMCCSDKDALTLQYLLSIPYLTLKNQASWGMGIVTGNNKRFIKNAPRNGLIPVYKGMDIYNGRIKIPRHFISSDMSLYQQTAPISIYEAKEKLVYKFISSRLCFFYDNGQRYFLNSANMLIPDACFPVSTKVLCELLNSDFMNWIFEKVFNTHKVLKSDLELLPIYDQFLRDESTFNEKDYLDRLGITKEDNGTYRTQR